MSTRAARESRQARLAAAATKPGRSHRTAIAAWASGLIVVLAVVAVMLATSQPTSMDSGRIAPGFTLTNSAGASVSLSDYRGRNVVLFFNEGAGCQSCLVQMAEIEKYAAAFKALNATVLPIVMNTRGQILRDMELNGVRTPFLLDDGRVSKAYGTLGEGMHADLPGHSFVLIDATGRERWYGEYPSMWLPPQQLLQELQSRLQT